MISHPPTFVLIGLGLALVAMFALGFYWLATKDQPTRPHSPIVSPPTRSAAVQRPAVDADEFDEWEAFSSHPDHVVQAAHEAATEAHDSYGPIESDDLARHQSCQSRFARTPVPVLGTRAQTLQ
ncbi:hypothetical protein [Burkholderia sp. GS2Y]|uniref:Secreted protein n=1 Tax=Burkholderia theae TaxID=3143496 RepID=A0ABU9WDG7_9BURK